MAGKSKRKGINLTRHTEFQLWLRQFTVIQASELIGVSRWMVYRYLGGEVPKDDLKTFIVSTLAYGKLDYNSFFLDIGCAQMKKYTKRTYPYRRPMKNKYNAKKRENRNRKFAELKKKVGAVNQGP